MYPRDAVVIFHDGAIMDLIKPEITSFDPPTLKTIP